MCELKSSLTILSFLWVKIEDKGTQAFFLYDVLYTVKKSAAFPYHSLYQSSSWKEASPRTE